MAVRYSINRVGIHLTAFASLRGGRLLLTDVKQIFYDIADEKDLSIIEMEVDKDHIHLLVQYNPTQSILEIVRHFKQISTYRIWRQNNNHLILKKQFWKEKTFWSDGYFACSIGNISKETIEKYIQTQG